MRLKKVLAASNQVLKMLNPAGATDSDHPPSTSHIYIVQISF